LCLNFVAGKHNFFLKFLSVANGTLAGTRVQSSLKQKKISPARFGSRITDPFKILDPEKGPLFAMVIRTKTNLPCRRPDQTELADSKPTLPLAARCNKKGSSNIWTTNPQKEKVFQHNVKGTLSRKKF
jgi:hypothetical protein